MVYDVAEQVNQATEQPAQTNKLDNLRSPRVSCVLCVASPACSVLDQADVSCATTGPAFARAGGRAVLGGRFQCSGVTRCLASC